MRVWQRVFRGAAGPACYNIRGVISASQDGPGGENRGWRQHKRFTRPTDAPPGLPALAGGHRGSGPRRRESANLKPYIAESACDQTIWDTHARLGPRTGDSGHSCSAGTANRRFGTVPSGWAVGSRNRRLGNRDAGEARTRSQTTRPPPRQIKGQPHARLGRPGPIDSAPCLRHVIRPPAPSPPRSRHCAAAG